MFLTHHNLQGSQTVMAHHKLVVLFLTHHNLQGSQTQQTRFHRSFRFLTHHNLQGSQTKHRQLTLISGFLPIIIYKVLKHKPELPQEIAVSYPS